MRRQFPGKQIGNAQAQLTSITSHTREALRLRSRQPISIDQADTALVEPWYLLAYIHPVHEFKNRLFQTDRTALTSFLRAEFQIEEMSGVDIIVTPPSMNMFIIGNHDGELFMVTKP